MESIDVLMKSADIVRHAYQVNLCGAQSVYAVGKEQVQRFDCKSKQWRVCGQGLTWIRQHPWSI